MAGILDFFGGGPAPTPGLLDAAGYMDPAQYDAARRSQGMMGLWAGLLQGGGPSLEPRNFGSALGAGVAGMNTFGNQFDESQLQAAQAAAQRATVQKNLADIDIKKKGYQLAQDWLNKGGAPPGAAPVGDGTGGVPNFGGTYKGEGDPASLVKHYESGGNYNIGYGGTDLSNAPRDQYGFPQWAGKDNSHAAGAYQFQPATWARYAGPLGIKDFSPESQDKVFAAAFAAEGWKPWAPYNPRLAAEVAQRTSAGAAARTTAPSATIPDFTEGRSAQFGGPVPAAVTGAPVAPAPAPLATAPAPSWLPPGATPGFGRIPLPNPSPRGAPGLAPMQLPTGNAVPGNNIQVEPLSGEAVPAGAGPSLAPGGVFSPAAQAAAAGPIGRAPDNPAAAAAANIGAAPNVIPPPGAVGTIPAQAVAPAPAAVTLPPSPAGAARGAAPAPGGMTVTLPEPPALQLPAAGTTPQARPLPPAPETPAIPPRPQIPGVAPGAGVSPAVAARARQAQGVVLGLSMMGVHVPSFLEKEAGIEIAGRTAAAEAEMRQPIELQNKTFEASLTAAQKRWDALTKDQQDEVAWQRGLTGDHLRAQYSNIHEQYKIALKLATEPQLQASIAQQTLPTEIAKIEKKEQAQADNTQTTMVIGGRKVPMTVGDANRITRGESPVTVLGPGVLQLGEEYLTDAQKSRAQAGATKSVEYSFKRLEDADTAGGAASRNLQTTGQLAQAAERFKTGATAEIWLDIKRYARDAGLITGDDVPDGEIIRQGSTKLAVMGAPRQGAMSNYERGLMATINPQLVNSPEAFGQLIAISARLDQYDMQVARIHNEVAEKNLGVPDYLEANRRIRDLGPPISAAERAALDRLQTTKDAAGAPAAPPAAPTGAAPYRWDPAANGGQGAVVPNTGR